MSLPLASEPPKGGPSRPTPWPHFWSVPRPHPCIFVTTQECFLERRSRKKESGVWQGTLRERVVRTPAAWCPEPWCLGRWLQGAPTSVPCHHGVPSSCASGRAPCQAPRLHMSPGPCPPSQHPYPHSNPPSAWIKTQFCLRRGQLRAWWL